MDATMTSRLVVDALDMAVRRRLPGEGLLAHSDRGSQYASDHYQRLLGKHGIACSMSGVAQCWDNAPVESFFATPEEGAGPPREVHHPRGGQGEHLRVHRGVLQPRPPALLPGVLVPGGVRAVAQPEPPLTSSPFFLGKSRHIPRSCHHAQRQQTQWR